MTQPLPETLMIYVESAVASTFAADGHLVAPTPSASDRSPTGAVAAVMRLEMGEENASFLLSASRQFLLRTHPANTGVPENTAPSTLTDAAINDWLGEITNLVVGRLRQSLLAHSIAGKSGPPSISPNPEELFAQFRERGICGCLQFGEGEQVDLSCMLVVPNESLPVLAQLNNRPAEDLPKPGEALLIKKAK